MGGDSNDNLSSLQQTSDGGYILGGSSESGNSGDKTGGPFGAADFWAVKLNADGTKVWDKTFGSQWDDYLNALQQTTDGGYILGGSFSEFKSFGVSSKFWIIKLNADGSKAWDNTPGGGIDSYLTALQQTSDGGYILGGRTSDSPNEEGGIVYTGYSVIKTDENGDQVWSKYFDGESDEYNSDENLIALQQTSDGGYILGGFIPDPTCTDNNEGETVCLNEYRIVKLFADGVPDWEKTYGGTGDDKLTSLQLTSDGGYILAGYSNSGISGDKTESNQGGFDYWLLKLQENIPPPPVTTSWNLRFGGSGTDRFTTVIKTSDGGYIAGGYSNSGVSGDKSQASKGGYDFWIVKTDATGKKLWDKTYGGTADDYLARIISTKDGGYILAGSSKSNIGGDKSENSQGDQDYWIVKVDAVGTKLWDKTYGGSGRDDFRKVNQLADGGYILAGQSNSPLSGDKSQQSRGNIDYWIIRTDASGKKLWDKTYGGTHHDYLETFTKTSDGGFLLAGSSASGFGADKTQASKGSQDYWLVKINAQGKKLWDKAYGGSGKDELQSIGYNAKGEFFIAGQSTSDVSGDKSQESKGQSDYWMLLLNKQGEKIWDKSFGGSGTETLHSIIQTKGQGYILAGSSDSNISGDKTQASQGGSDYWIVKTDKADTKEYDQRYGGSGTEEFRSIQQTEDGGLLLGGRSDSGKGGDRTQPSQGGTDYWLVKVAPLTTATASRIAQVNIPTKEEAITPVNFTVAPNPFQDKVGVSFTIQATQTVSLKLYDSLGKVVATLLQGEVQANKTYEIQYQPGANQPTGMYLLRLQTPRSDYTRKILFTR